MKKKFMKWKGFRILTAVCMALLLLLGVVPGVWASDTGSGGQLGSLSMTLAVTEDGAQVPLADVPLSLYQVGTMEIDTYVVHFQLASSLESTGIDLNNLKTAADAEAAAKTLVNKVGSAGVPVKTAVSDVNGNVSFTSLEMGVYLMVQTGNLESCRVSPMLISVPYSSDGSEADLEYNVTAYPKAEKNNDSNTGTLKVTKKLYLLDDDWVDIYTPEATYYVRLYLDEAATIPYGDAKAIHIVGDTSGTVEYTDLPLGTYYVRETDAEGNPRPDGDSFLDETGTEVICSIDVNGETGSMVTFDNVNFDVQEAVVNNIYLDLPDNFYMERLLWIQKNVVKDGQQTTVDDTFYATVNEVQEDGSEVKVETLELKQNDKVSLVFQSTDIADKDKVFKYRVFESDKDGKAVDKATFGYKVSGEGNLTFDGEKELTVTITNTVTTTTPTPTPTPTQTPEITPGTTPGTTPGVTPGITPTTSRHSVKTGDKTNIIIWFVVLFVAAAAVGFVIARKKKK